MRVAHDEYDSGGGGERGGGRIRGERYQENGLKGIGSTTTIVKSILVKSSRFSTTADTAAVTRPSTSSSSSLSTSSSLSSSSERSETTDTETETNSDTEEDSNRTFDMSTFSISHTEDDGDADAADDDDVEPYEIKCVHFAMTNAYVESHIVLSNREMDRMWWSRVELIDIRRLSMKRAAMTGTQFRADLDKVYSSCTRDEAGCFLECLRVRSASIIGLELLAHPMMVQNRQATRRSLLHTQTMLSYSAKTESQREKFLAAHSRHLTRQSKHMAQLFGSADALLVRKMHFNDGEYSTVPTIEL